MPISTHCLETYVNNCASASPNCLETQQLAGVATAVDQAVVGCSVPNIASLPSAIDNEGRWIFVEDISAYRYSDGFEWTNNYDTSCVVSNPAYSWGRNNYGQLGTDNKTGYSSPVQEITLSTNWYKVSVGSFNTHGIKKDGTLWSLGYNLNGQLADNSTTSKSSPIQEITSTTTWCALTQKAAIKTDNTLWAWGENTYGSVGDNTTINKSSPVQEVSSSSWSYICGDSERNIGIKTDGSLWFWGRSERGESAAGVSICNYSSPVQEFFSAINWCKTSTNRYHSLAINTSGELYGSGDGNYLFYGVSTQSCSFTRELCSSTNWCGIASSSYVGHGLKTDGTLWSWGTNITGVLGNNCGSGSSFSPIQEITSSTSWCHVNSGYFTPTAIKTDGTLWSWGSNNYGQIGDETISNKSSPVQEITSKTNWCFSASYTSTVAIKQEVKGFNEP